MKLPARKLVEYFPTTGPVVVVTVVCVDNTVRDTEGTQIFLTVSNTWPAGHVLQKPLRTLKYEFNGHGMHLTPSKKGIRIGHVSIAPFGEGGIPCKPSRL